MNAMYTWSMSGATVNVASVALSLPAAPPPVPVIKDIHQRVYEAASQPGALFMGDWHLSETTHCRAGWVVALAGEQGRALERAVGTRTAALKIYNASDPRFRPHEHIFCQSNRQALEDMREAADAERAARRVKACELEPA